MLHGLRPLADGCSVFLSSHILSEVESMCDRVALIKDGRLSRIGGVAELKDIKRHEVELTFTTTPPIDVFCRLAGLQRVETLPNGRTLRITVQGEIDVIVKAAAQYPLTNFVSREPSLEDIFLRYYQDDGLAPRKDTGSVVP